jgi:hypothetical protein
LCQTDDRKQPKFQFQLLSPCVIVPNGWQKTAEISVSRLNQLV